MDLQRKLEMLADAAKYDASCPSGGTARKDSRGSALHFTPGVPRSAAPDDDALDDLWRTYYRSIFNPARLKVPAMQSEMPKKYWKNLPEAPLIADLIAESGGRVEKMLRTELRPAKPAPNNAYLDSLRDLNRPGQPQPDDPPQTP